MIDRSNLKSFLRCIGFNGTNEIYEKSYINNTIISVNFSKEEIKYPKDLIVNDMTTSNFEHSENFVVLECINRLLEKGYSSRNIEIEPKWHLGRDTKRWKSRHID